MAEIRHRVGVAAPAQQVFDAVATLHGLRSWWTTDVRGDPSLGGRLDFHFGDAKPGAVMEVADLASPARVEWRCVASHAEWVDTRVTFELEEGRDETVLLFTHGGWQAPTPFMAHCSTKWAQFLLGLKASFEGGKATPFPDDPKASSWS